MRQCGTDSGYHLHLGRQEKPCGACMEAHRLANRAWLDANRDHVNEVRRRWRKWTDYR
jgi:hypothetical protein